MGEFLQWQWRDWLSKQVPQEYFEELRGLTDGGYAAGVKSDVGDLSAQGIVLANFPGDLKNLKYLFRDEWIHRDDAKEVLELLIKHNPNGGYGAYAFGLSGFSPTLKTFAGGPGQLAVHGTNKASALGGKASHGCVRVSNDDITWMAKNLAIGTPVVVKA